MKQIISWIMAVALSMSLSSCFEKEAASPVEELYKLSFTNGTDQTIVIKHNIGGANMEEVITLGKGEEESFYSSVTKVPCDPSFLWEYVVSIDESAYVRVYSEDGALLKEWKKSDYDYIIKNPFDYKYYEDSPLSNSRKGIAVSTFVIYGWLFVLE